MQLPPRPDDTDGVRLALDEGVATLTLSNPRRKNAITPPMWGELTEAFRWMAHDDTVRAVVVTGEGDDFCSGADLSDGPKVHATAYMRYLNEGPLALHSLAKPTIARVDGIAAGAGLNLALGCDLIVASDRAPSARSSPGGRCRSTTAAPGCCPGGWGWARPRSWRCWPTSSMPPRRSASAW
ncbi:MAG: enoyl-CoA hydratase/isomerase family protein [Acidimicrobiales bacterium]